MRRYHLSFCLEIKSEISSHESFITTVCADGDLMISQGHFGAADIKKKTSMLSDKWEQLNVCTHGIPPSMWGGGGWQQV